MTSALQIARSGLDALDEKMKAISNNLANVSTTGFKKDRANFETLMYQSGRSPGDPSGATRAGQTVNTPSASARAPGSASPGPSASTPRDR